MSDPIPVPRPDFRELIQGVLAEVQTIAKFVLDQPDEDKSDTINSRNSGRILVSSGLDDIKEAQFSLFRLLSRADDQERLGLYQLLRGVRDVMGYGVAPSAALLAWGDEQARRGTAAGRKKLETERRAEERDAILRAALEGHEGWSDQRVLSLVNDQLKAAGLQEMKRSTLNNHRNRLKKLQIN